MADRPLFPLLLFIYREDGMHDDGIQIVSEGQLTGPGTKMVMDIAMKQGVEIRMTDPDDFLVFHANHGKVLFPPPMPGVEVSNG